MASTGAKLPSSGASVSSSPWSDDAWVNPGNVTAIDTTYASVTASTFDSGDQTYRLRCTGFDFSAIPDGSTINGITVKINNARYANGTGSLDLCQLVSSGTPIGNNKYSTPQALTTTATTDYTVGGTSDVWGASLTAAIVKDSSFGVDIGCLSTGANTDVYIDAVEMTVEYTEPSPPKLYYVIYASAGSEPSAAQIKAGQDATGSAAVASGNETARTTTGEEVFAAAASGLTPSTGYKVSFVWSDGTNDSNVVVTSAWSTAEPVEIDAGIGQAIAAGVQASIVDSTVISCVVGEASAHGLGAQVLAGTTIEAAIGEAVAQGLDAQIIVSAAIEATVGAAVAAGLPATVSSPQTIAAEIGQAVAAGLPVSISSGAIVLAGVGRAVAAGLPATIETVVSLSGWQKPAGKARKYRRVILGDRLYEVLERDIPALLEAELLDRAPPTTAEVIEGPKPRRKRARKAPQPVKTVAEVRQAVRQIKRRIEPDNAWLMQALETVAQRVLERLQDEEDSIMLLLAA